MISGAVVWILRDRYWIVEGERKMNKIGNLRPMKVEQNGLIGSTDQYPVSVILDQITNKLVNCLINFLFIAHRNHHSKSAPDPYIRRVKSRDLIVT
jgi:hypothetical protein